MRIYGTGSALFGTLSVALTVKVYTSAREAVPEITPVIVFRITPLGNAPAEMLNVIGAVQSAVAMAVEYGTLIVPAGNGETVVMEHVGPDGRTVSA